MKTEEQRLMGVSSKGNGLASIPITYHIACRDAP
jgi:hypothetical protein